MEQANNIHNRPPFNEDEWLKLLFLLSDTQSWLNDLVSGAIIQVPVKDKKRLFRKTYYITVSALAHIIERHYYKILRHPSTSKFTIPITEIVSYLRDASSEPITPVSGSLHFKRVIDAGATVGFDYNGIPTTIITILTDSGGKIITAFPGSMKPQSRL